MEAAIANLISPGDSVLTIIQGKFSERWLELVKVYKGNPIELHIEWGKAVLPDDIKPILEKNKDIKFICFCHNETSTGVLNPGKEIGKIAREYGKILIADCVTSAGGDYVFPDEFNFDIAVSGSQKCIGIPPGLGMISLNQRAWNIINNRKDIIAYYFDLRKYRDNYQKNLETPFTPAISLFYALQEALTMIFEEGFEERVKRHRLMGKALRAGIKALGLKLFADENYASNTVTSVSYPPTINDSEFRKKVKEYGILISGGQDKVKGKIFRIAHMNMCDKKDILMILSIIELCLKELNYPLDHGSGVAAAQNIFLNNK